MATSEYSSRYVEAYRLMKSGALLILIATLLTIMIIPLLIIMMIQLIGVSFLSLLSQIPAMLGLGMYVGSEVILAELTTLIIWLIVLIVLMVISVITAIYGLFDKFIPGISKLAELDPEFKTTKTLIRIGYLGGIILLLIGMILLVVSIPAGLVVFVLALILLFIGYIGLVVLSVKLYDKEKNALYIIAGVLFIMGVFFIIIPDLIAWILLYVALEDSIKRASTTPTSAHT